MWGKGLAWGAVVVGLGWGAQTTWAVTAGGKAFSAARPGPALLARDVEPLPHPLAVPETQVEARDTQSGVALVFTTTEGGLAEVRERVKTMVVHHNDGSYPGLGVRSQPMPRAWASYEELRDGARIVFEPVMAEDLSELRATVRDRAAAMRARPATAG